MSRKSDTINYREFNKLSSHSDTHQDPLPSQVLFDDENIIALETTLMGMEYDSEDLDELEDELEDLDELEDQEESEAALELSGEEEDTEDMVADLDSETDESAKYEGRPN